MRLKWVALCCTLCLCLQGCLLFSHVQYSGFPSASVKLWSDVKAGASKDDVIAMLGHPVIVEEGIWIYPSCKLLKSAASIMKKYECNVLRIAFDSDDRATDVDHLHTPLQSLRNISEKGHHVSGIHDGMWRKIAGALGKNE
ncbi:hypothetical protein ANPL_02230 [Anaplasma platys]|uniref:Lipoprotein n=1 Tax=Anaplasma platys TaxID=949 RepID=A0A858PY61_9RICK|nr:hypothetical protein [Anaplasma platys]QJC27525.1 hypothetical protein ANPL_02230 [Anaplasma platys]